MSSAQTDSSRNRTSIINTIPLSYRDEILRIPGVKYITHNNWFGGVYQDAKNLFPQFVIDPENQRQVFPELIVPDDQWNTFLKDRQGVIVGAATMERFGWRIGDRIPITTTIYGLAGKPFEFNIDGVYHGAKPQDDDTSSGSDGNTPRKRTRELAGPGWLVHHSHR